jgi:hypothetical protein
MTEPDYIFLSFFSMQYFNTNKNPFNSDIQLDICICEVETESAAGVGC